MADGHIIYKKCTACNGTGLNPQFVGDAVGAGAVLDEACLVCDGAKFLLWGWMTKDDEVLPDFLPV